MDYWCNLVSTPASAGSTVQICTIIKKVIYMYFARVAYIVVHSAYNGKN